MTVSIFLDPSPLYLLRHDLNLLVLASLVRQLTQGLSVCLSPSSEWWDDRQMVGLLSFDVDCGLPDPDLEACVTSCISFINIVPSLQPVTFIILQTKTVGDIVFLFTTYVYTGCGVIPFLMTAVR